MSSMFPVIITTCLCFRVESNYLMIRSDCSWSTMNILTIPKELQFHILGFLPVPDRLRVSETCHLLKDVARDPSLWKKLALRDLMIWDNNKSCRDHVARCSSLKELVISSPHTLQGRIRSDMIPSDKIMNVVMEAKRSIKTLSIANFKLSNSSFKQIGQLTHLTKLDIDAVNIKSDGIAILANLSELKSLKMKNLQLCTLDNLVDFFSILRKLEVVVLQGYRQLNDEVIESLVINNPNLYHLNIKNTSYLTQHSLTGRSLRIIADNCPHITHIDIGNIRVFRNDDIKIVSKCSKLKYASFEYTRIEDSVLERLANDCPDLEDLNLSECRHITVAGIEAFLDKASKAKLKCLDIRHCRVLYTTRNFGSIADQLKLKYPLVDIVYM